MASRNSRYGEPDVLRHAQCVVIGLAFVTNFRDLLDSPESVRKMVAIVPAIVDEQLRKHLNLLSKVTHLTGRLRFFSKSNVASKASSCKTNRKLNANNETMAGCTNLARCLPERLGPTRLARIVPAVCHTTAGA